MCEYIMIDYSLNDKKLKRHPNIQFTRPEEKNKPELLHTTAALTDAVDQAAKAQNAHLKVYREI